ncbi:MAG: hypothetical protein WCG27_01345 [Pseudomonadota bacterium]
MNKALLILLLLWGSTLVVAKDLVIPLDCDYLLKDFQARWPHRLRLPLSTVGRDQFHPNSSLAYYFFWKDVRVPIVDRRLNELLAQQIGQSSRYFSPAGVAKFIEWHLSHGEKWLSLMEFFPWVLDEHNLVRQGENGPNCHDFVSRLTGIVKLGKGEGPHEVEEWDMVDRLSQFFVPLQEGDIPQFGDVVATWDGSHDSGGSQQLLHTAFYIDGELILHKPSRRGIDPVVFQSIDQDLDYYFLDERKYRARNYQRWLPGMEPYRPKKMYLTFYRLNKSNGL